MSTHQRRFLRLKQVKELVPLNTSAIYEYIARGEFPRNYKLGPRAVAWLESDIQAWIEERITTANEGGQNGQ